MISSLFWLFISLGMGITSFSFSWFTENGEDIQVLRYEHGQKYEPHYDYFSDKVNIVRGGHRLATVLMYLSDVAKGGETVFPNAEVSSSALLTLMRTSLMHSFSQFFWNTSLLLAIIFHFPDLPFSRKSLIGSLEPAT